jgi:hypothetical protein
VLVTGACALAATAILLALACLQAQLAAGRLGRFARGGTRDAADIVDALPGRWTGTAAWVLAGFFLLAVAMNGGSRSRDERRTGTPAALALCLLCVAVAVDA